MRVAVGIAISTPPIRVPVCHFCVTCDFLIRGGSLEKFLLGAKISSVAKYVLILMNLRKILSSALSRQGLFRGSLNRRFRKKSMGEAF